MSRVLKPSGSQIEEREDVLDRGTAFAKALERNGSRLPESIVKLERQWGAMDRF